MIRPIDMRKVGTAAVLIFWLGLLVATVARGATTAMVSVSSTVTGGSTLSVAPTGSPSFGITLNGIDQTVGYTLPVSVVDARGNGGGWNLTVTSTTFDDGTGLGSGHTFPATASTITGVATSCGSGSTCTTPSNNVSNSSLTIPAGSTAPAAVKYYNAGASSGMGTVNADATVAVTIPANVFAGTYTSTVTVAIAAGP
jgi:WxL domain surface cell wall-binding